MKPTKAVAKRIRRGAALLDEQEPGWRDRICPGDLEMENCARCIVGQACGLDEMLAPELFSERLEGWGIQDPEAKGTHAHAFNGAEEGLGDAWIGYIKGEWS